MVLDPSKKPAPVGAILPKPLPADKSKPLPPKNAVTSIAAAIAAKSKLSIDKLVPPKPAEPTYSYLLKVTIGDIELSNLKGDFIGTPVIRLRTRQYSEFNCILTDPSGDLWPKIKAAEGQPATIEIGYPPTNFYKKITGAANRIGRQLPTGVTIEIVDSTAKLNQSTGAAIVAPEPGKEATPADPKAATAKPNEALKTATTAQGQPPTAAAIAALAKEQSKTTIAATIAAAKPLSTVPLTDAKTNPVTQKQLDNSKAAAGGVTQIPATAKTAKDAGLQFQSQTPSATGSQGKTVVSLPGLQAQTQEAGKQGDVVIAGGDGTVAQVAPGQGKKTGIIIDWKLHKGAFIRPPTITKKTPLQLPSSVTVRGWSLADGQSVGATVVTPTIGTDTNATIQIPELGAIKFTDPIYPGCLYTWGDSANQEAIRRPRSKEIAAQIAKIAKIIQEFGVKYNGGKKMEVTSWYRPPEINAAVSSTGTTGPHTTGNAVDVWFNPPKLIEFHKYLDANWAGGVAIHPAVYQGAGFVHIDLGSKRRWSY